MSPTDRPHTQIDFRGAFDDEEAPSPPPLTLPLPPPTVPAKRNLEDNEARPKHRELKLVRAKDSQLRAHEYFESKIGSPWSKYEKEYELRLDPGTWATVAVRNELVTRSAYEDLVLIRTVKGPDVEKKLEVLKSIQNKRFLLPLQIFHDYDGTVRIVHEFMAIPLAIAAGNPLLEDPRLAAIFVQIIEGVIYLEEKDLEHGSLSTSTILLHPYGQVKITLQESCASRPRHNTSHLKALKRIFEDLKEGCNSRRADFAKSPRLSPLAREFYGKFDAVTSAAALLDHRFITLSKGTRSLTPLVVNAGFLGSVGLKMPSDWSESDLSR